MLGRIEYIELHTYKNYKNRNKTEEQEVFIDFESSRKAKRGRELESLNNNQTQ